MPIRETPAHETCQTFSSCRITAPAEGQSGKTYGSLRPLQTTSLPAKYGMASPDSNDAAATAQPLQRVGSEPKQAAAASALQQALETQGTQGAQPDIAAGSVSGRLIQQAGSLDNSPVDTADMSLRQSAVTPEDAVTVFTASTTLDEHGGPSSANGTAEEMRGCIERTLQALVTAVATASSSNTTIVPPK